MNVGDYLRLMRPGDWMKNVFVLPAFVFSLPALLASEQSLLTPMFQTAGAFVAFCLLCSGFYAINDAIDADSDRLHPIKQRRPVASGQISPSSAAVFGAVLIVVAMAVGFALAAPVGVVLVLYGLLQAAYNIRLKRVLLVDVVAIAIGFALRAAAGALALETQISIWLLMCVFFLCVYLGFIKRMCDITSARTQSDGAWRTAAGYDSESELTWLLGVSAVMAVMTYLMYALSTHAHSIFGSRAIGFALLSPLVLITIHRFYRRARTGVSDSPLAALRDDRTVLACVLLYVIGTLAVLTTPGVESVLDQLFIAGDGQMDADMGTSRDQ